MSNASVPVPGESRTEWHCVVLGDTSAGGFPRHLAVRLKHDLGVDATIHDWRRTGLTLVELAEMLGSQMALRSLVQRAEMVILAVPVPRMGLCVNGQGEGLLGDMPLAMFMQTFRVDLNWAMNELLRLTSPQRALVRTMDFVCPSAAYWRRWAGMEACLAAWLALNDELHTMAAAWAIPVARLFQLFHGAAGDGDPWARGLFSGVEGEVSDAGASAVADALSKMGYRRSR